MNPPGLEGRAKKEQMILLAHAGDVKQFLPLMDAWRKESGENAIDATTRGRMDRLHANHRQHGQILTALWVALILTAMVMTGALTVLANADRLPADSCLGAIAPGVGVTGFVVCLISYLVLISLALGGHGRVPPQA